MSGVQALLAGIAAIGADPSGGWSRPAWGAAEQAAHDWFAAQARAMGLSVRQDAFGNSIARREGREALPAIATGSHLDTVRNGGLYDGALGVVLGLEAARRLPAGLRPLEVIAFRDEEGRFGPFTGSRAMTGDLTPDAADRLRDAEGMGLRAAMTDCGLAPTSAARDLSELAAWVEVHIEQGPVLEQAGLPLGIVTAIAGQERFGIRFTGQAGHAGTVPMDRRADAFQAAAQFALAFDTLLREAGGDARGTIGIVRVEPNQANVIPREVRLSLEIRDSDPARLAALAADTEALAEATAQDRHVTAQTRRQFSAPPVPMDPRLMDTLETAARTAGHPTMRLLSGANHDAGVLGRHIPTAMLFVPSRAGISHAPEEHTDPGPIEAAADVLTAALARLTESPGP